MTNMTNYRAALVQRARACRRFLADEDGATAIEYGLIAALISIAIVASVRSYTQTTSSMYSDIVTTYGEAVD